MPRPAAARSGRRGEGDKDVDQVGERTEAGQPAAATGSAGHAPQPQSVPGGVEMVRRVGTRIATNIEQVIEGKHGAIKLGVTVLLAEGHLLIEDVPGVGKTKFAKALARSIDCSVRRVQFTPDLLPSDITGVSVYNSEDRDFEFKPGPVFANIVVGDEINRASPKTQAALLECMEERQVTVDGITYALESPFMVLATQNPIDMEGTYPLPEAQRDRFTARISMGYPDRARRDRDARRARRARPARHPAAGVGRRRGPRADRRGPRGARLRRRSRPTRSTWPRRPGGASRGPPRRLAAGHAAAAARRQGVGRARRP